MILSTNRAAALALLCAVASAPASASIKYDFSAGGMGVSSGSLVSGHTVGPATGSDPGPNVTIYGLSGGSSGAVGLADVKTWTGLGVHTPGESTASPNHATDNNGSYEAAALIFSQAIALSDVSLGWWQNDSDLTVLAYTGAGTPGTLGTLGTWASLTGPSGGWTLMGHYANVANQPSDTTSLFNDTATRGTPISSSYWLIAAYNPLVGSGPVFNSGGIGTGAPDYVKISGVAGTIPSTSVPEPSVLALLGIGLLGLARQRYALKA